MQENENLRDVQRKCYKFIKWSTDPAKRGREEKLSSHQFRSRDFK